MRHSFGDLVRCSEGGWMVLPPKQCQNGHPLGPNMVLVGHQACAGSCHGGHVTWTCREPQCDGVIYAPGMGAGCRRLDGAAFKR